MNKQTITTALLALIAMAGQGQIKCHVEGTLETNAWGDEVIICEAGTDLRVVDEPRFHVKAKDGKFTYDIETDFPRLYDVFFLKQYETGRWFVGKFLAENCNVNVTMFADKKPRFNPDRRAEFFKADFISAINEAKTWNVDSLPQAYVDSVRQIINHYMQNRNEMYTTKGWQLKQQRDSITDGLRPFRLAYAKEHPMLWTLYDVLDAIQTLKHADDYVNFDPSEWEPYLTLYHDKFINLYPSHPIHDQIATAETAYRLQLGKPYIDYTVRNTDGQLVPISSFIRGKVALIDLWASWCGPCRRHSIAMIPVYEKYKDKGFTVIAIARERNRQAMENAAKKDGYPWPSLLELNDENQVWRKNGAGNAGGAMYLIDRDGTILSTSTDAEELEPLIKKALNIE